MEAVRTIDESRSAEPQTVASPAPPNGSAKTILVIDDSAMLLSFVKEILEEQNYDILTAPTATEGMEDGRASAVPRTDRIGRLRAAVSHSRGEMIRSFIRGS